MCERRFTDISATVALIGVKFCMMLSVPDNLLPFWEWYPQGIPKSDFFGLNFGNLTVNIKPVILSVTYQ